MNILNETTINENVEEIGGTWGCILACGGTCLITDAVGSAFGAVFSMT